MTEVSGPSDDEGVLDPWVAKWLEENPQVDWSEGFPPEILEAARGYEGPPPTRNIDEVRDEMVGDVPIRVYRNDGPATGVVVYFHGGAFTVGSVKIMDGVARELAHASRAVVVSVDYRLAPENPYPAGFDDCVAVTKWVLANCSETFGVPSTRVVVAGESAGGNLATAVALRLRDEDAPNVAGQVLVYPCTDGPDATYPSRDQFGWHDWVWDSYGGGRDLSQEPYAVPMSAESLRGLPPALVLLAGCDALRDEGRAYAHRLLTEGVEVEAHCFAGQPHGFVNFGLPAAADVYERIARWMRAHL
jgi:acetyl esterase/lipase